eukprot:m.460306 g.460306  ORF g.460306 m.460306 type:complete len:351 (-) comp21999_c0_seq1:75-1127(-)
MDAVMARWQLLMLLGVAVIGQAAGADPTCATGIAKAPCCCPASCGVCGGTSCQNHKGGPDSCCCSAIEHSNRSCTDFDPPCVIPPPPLPPIPPPSAVVRRKRGFVADGGVHCTCDDPLLLNVSGWFYDYNKPNPYRAPSLSGNCAAANASGRLDQRFTPMDWCLDGMPTPTPPYVNQTYFMGFNEPNNLHNCNTEPAKVAQAWKTVMDSHPNSMLVSPATAGNGLPWFDQFFGNCTALYGGTNGCRISYLAAHDYSCDPNTTLTYLKTLHDRYGFPVWLTEFSCGDGADAKPTDDHIRFMAKILPLLDEADYVFRYAWMSARQSPPELRPLLTTVNGKAELTTLGHLYNA